MSKNKNKTNLQIKRIKRKWRLENLKMNLHTYI